MRAEVAELRSAARIFQNTKCTACTSALDLPAIHFLCMHSFHQRCLGENEKECPVCAPANRTVLEASVEPSAGRFWAVGWTLQIRVSFNASILTGKFYIFEKVEVAESPEPALAK